jgi:hypothetical protein
VAPKTTRRDFLRRAGAAGLALPLLPWTFTILSLRSPSEKLKIAGVGVGQLRRVFPL